MARAEAPEMQVGQAVAVALDRVAQFAVMAVSGFMSSRMALVSRISVSAHEAMTKAPTMPASGSIHSQPKVLASKSSTITSTDTAASAMTCTSAARKLLSRWW